MIHPSSQCSKEYLKHLALAGSYARTPQSKLLCSLPETHQQEGLTYMLMHHCCSQGPV